MHPSQVIENVARVRERVAQALERAGRGPDAVKIVAISKGKGPEYVQAAVEAGLTLIGESRVQEAEGKIPKVRGVSEWHLVGHLQTNKVKSALGLFDVIQSVDRFTLVDELQKRCGQTNREIRLLVEVNISGEASKSGVDSAGLKKLLLTLSEFPQLRVEGLMTIPPYSEDPQHARPYFQQLRILRDKMQDEGIPGLSLKELSIGMSHDFDFAIEEGATMVRIGEAIFGPRPVPARPNPGARHRSRRR